MFTLNHDELGTIQADTEKELQAELRKRKREYGKAQKIRSEKRSRASELARLNGFAILSRLVDPDRDSSKPAMPSAWRVYSPDNGKNYSGVTYSRYSDNHLHYSVWQGSESAEFNIWREYRIIGAVGNTDGALCVFQQNHRNEVDCFAIGIYSGEVYLLPLPGVSMSDFPNRTETT
jgi:hypothetical protein